MAKKPKKIGKRMAFGGAATLGPYTGDNSGAIGGNSPAPTNKLPPGKKSPPMNPGGQTNYPGVEKPGLGRVPPGKPTNYPGVEKPGAIGEGSVSVGRPGAGGLPPGKPMKPPVPGSDPSTATASPAVIPQRDYANPNFSPKPEVIPQRDYANPNFSPKPAVMRGGGLARKGVGQALKKGGMVKSKAKTYAKGGMVKGSGCAVRGVKKAKYT